MVRKLARHYQGVLIVCFPPCPNSFKRPKTIKHRKLALAKSLNKNNTTDVAN